VLDSLRLLTDACASFTEHCVRGLTADVARIDELLGRSLMLVTALVPHIGHDRAAQIAQQALARGLTLREAATTLGGLSGDDFDRWVDARRMTGPDAEARVQSQ
jgi:fumarate hydratase, class II